MPYTGVKTDVLIFTKGQPTKKVWFFNIENDGFELNVGRRSIEGENDIDMLLDVWEEKKIIEHSWFVDISEIKKNDFSLLLKKKSSKKTNSYTSEDSKRFIEEAIKIEEDISKELSRLKEVLNEYWKKGGS